jgi:hypothetical protein
MLKTIKSDLNSLNANQGEIKQQLEKLGAMMDIIKSFIASYQDSNDVEAIIQPTFLITTDENLFNNDCLNTNYVKQMVRTQEEA